MAKKKKAPSDRSPLSILQAPLLMLLLLIPVMVPQDAVWVFHRHALHLPLSAEPFEDIFHFLSGFRLVVPFALMPVATSLVTFLNPILLLVLFQALSVWLPVRKALAGIAAFGVCCALSPLAQAGEAPDRIAEILATVLILSIFFIKTTGLRLWLIGTLGVGLSFTFEDLKPLVAWTLFSFALTQIVHFLFVLRLQPARRERQRLIYFCLEWLGLILFSVWSFVTILKSPLSLEIFGPSKYFWLSFLAGLLCAVNCWFSPWIAGRWLGLATFAQGGLIFKNLDLALWIVIAFNLIALVDHAISAGTGKNFAMPRWLARLATISTLATFLALAYLLVDATPRARSLVVPWVDVIESLQTRSNEGVLIVGRGMPFVATFHEGVLATHEGLLLETKEEAFVEELARLRISTIVIEEDDLREKWTELIQAGQSPKTINRSILSKLVNHDGKEVKTPTLKLEALKSISKVDSDQVPKGFTIANYQKEERAPD